MARFPKIWFLRHGQTEWNLEGRIQGQLNSNLTDTGRAHAAAQAKLMAPIIDDILDAGGRIFVSPQGRAMETAHIALNGYPFQTDARLAEIKTGEWEGCLHSEVCPEISGLEAYCAAPGGEGFEALHARVEAFLGSLQTPTVLVSHGILGQVLRGTVRNLNRKDIADLSNDQGCVYVLENGTEEVLR